MRLVRCIKRQSKIHFFFLSLLHILRERERERERERVYRSIICLHLSVCPSVCQSVFYKDVTIYFYSSSLGTVETTRQMKRSCRPGRWNDLPDPAKTDCLGMWIWKGSVCLSRSDESVYVDQMKQSCRSGRWNKVVDPADDTLWQTRQMTRSGRPGNWNSLADSENRQ